MESALAEPPDPNRWLEDEYVLNIPKAVASRYARSHHEREEFVSIGNHVLVQLAQRFDLTRVKVNPDFGAYAHKYISMSIRGVIKDQYKHLNGDYTGVSNCRKVGALVPSYSKPLEDDLEQDWTFDDGRLCVTDPGPEGLDVRDAAEWLLAKLEKEESSAPTPRGLQRSKAKAIRMRYLEGKADSEAAKEFGVSDTMIGYLVRDGISRMAQFAREEGLL